MTICRFFYQPLMLAGCLAMGALSAFGQPTSLPKPSTWITDGAVYSIAEFGGAVYLGGNFRYVGPNQGTGVALNPGNGAVLGFPRVDGTVLAALADGSGGWFIGGSFTSVGEVARKNLAHINSNRTVDTSWKADTDGTVYALAENGTQLLVGGIFTNVGGLSRSSLASVRKSNGDLLSFDPNIDGNIYSLLVHNDILYLGGFFTEVDRIARTNLAAIDLNSKFSDVTSFAPNPNGPVYALHGIGTTIYAGGSYTVIDEKPRLRLSALSTAGVASSWIADASSSVYTLTSTNTTLYAGGTFTTINSIPRNRLAAISITANSNNVSSWNPNMSSTVRSIVLNGSQLLVGGFFETAGTQTAITVASIGTATGLPAWGLNNAAEGVYALALSGSQLLAGGTVLAGGVRRTNLAALTLSTGNALSWNPGANSTVYALAIGSTGTVYAAGSFTSVDGLVRNRLAAIDQFGNATAWNPNADNSVYALLRNGSTLYAGGSFTTINGVVRNRAASMNVNLNTGMVLSWDPDLNGTVEALALNVRSLYLGGTFTRVNGLSRTNLAAVDYLSSSVLSWAPNPNLSVLALAVDPVTDQVYAGGTFTKVGSSTRNRLAAIGTDGLPTAWNPNVNGTVYDLKLSGSLLYVGGAFSSLGSSSYIFGGFTFGTYYRTNAAALQVASTSLSVTSWRPDPVGTVRAIGLTASELLLGGSFTRLASDQRNHPSLASFVFNAPEITSHPVSRTVTAGDVAVLSASASGSSLRFQWRHDGTNLVGKTNTSLTLSNVTPADAGTYQLIVSNSFGTVQSRLAELTVLIVPPSIVVSPRSSSVIAGNSLLLEVVASGTPPLTYQWYHGGYYLNGATNRNLVISNAAPGDAGTYQVRVSNQAGIVYSGIAIVTVLEPPTLLEQPANQTVVSGNTVIFSVEAEGTAPFAYQWLYNGSNIFGATSNVLTLLNVQTNQTGLYSVRVSNQYGFVVSSNASLAISQAPLPPTIIYLSGHQVSAPGSNVFFYVVASGSPTLQYRWFYQGSPITGATSSLLSLNNIQSTNAGFYQVTVSNAVGSITSTSMLLQVIPFLVANEPRSDFPVTDGPVYSTLVTNGVIYLGGNFNFVRPNRQRGLLLDPSSALPDLDFPQVSGDIKAVIDDGSGGWFIGGDFSAVGNVALRNLAHIRPDKTVNTNWNPQMQVPSGGASWVSALARKDDTLYVGGYFTRLGTATRNMAAALNTRTGALLPWNPNARGSFNSGEVKTLAVVGEMVYAGGYFTNVGGLNRKYLAALDAVSGTPTSWNAPASDAVYSVAYACDVLVVAGLFTNLAGVPRKYFGAVDLATGVPSRWSADADNVVYSLATIGDTVYLGGAFQSLGGQSRRYLAAVDAESGEVLDWNPAADNKVSAVVASGRDVFVGGDFIVVGNDKRSRLASIDATTGEVTDWAPATSGEVYAIGVSEDGIYAGGVAGLGGTARNNAAALDARTGAILSWNPGPDGTVKALAYASNTVYLGGEFTKVKGVTRTRIAAVDPSGSGTLKSLFTGQASGPTNGGPVNALLAVGTNLYAGGWFTSIGGSNRNFLAALDPITGSARSWDPNLNDQVFTLASAGNLLYVGGAFTSAGGVSRQRLAAFSLPGLALSSSWQPIAGNTVYALAANSTAVYVGGAFTSLQFSTRYRLGALHLGNGSLQSWNPNVNSVVQSLLALNDLVYVGGQFSAIGSKARNRLASIDTFTGVTSLWNPNLGDQVMAMAHDGTNLVVGGVLDTVGGKFRPNLAVFPRAGHPVILTEPVSLQVMPNSPAQFSVVASGAGPLSYQWRFNGTALPGQTNSTLSNPSVVLGSSGNYSVVVSNSIGAVVSADALLVVMVPANISSSPISQVLTSGQTLYLSVAASGNPPPTYQWQLNGVNIPGANRSYYRVYQASPTNSGIYGVLVGNLDQVLRSQPAVVLVESDPLPFTNQFSQRVVLTDASGMGSGHNTNATAEPGEPRHFGKRGGRSMWLAWEATTNGVVRFSTRGSSFDTLLAAYQGSTVSNLTAIASDDDRGGFLTSEISFEVIEGQIYSLVVDGYGGARGDIVLSWDLDDTVSNVPRIVTQPFDVTAVPGQNATFSVIAVSSSGLEYQWYFNHCDAIPGATNEILNLFNVQESNVGAYTVRVSNNKGQSVESLHTFLELGPDGEAQSHDKFDDIFSIGTRVRSTFTSVAAGALGTQVLNNFGASTEYGEPLSCGVVGGSSRWFNLRAATNATLLVDTIGSSIDTLLTVYNGTDLFTLSVIACDNNSAPDGVRSLIRFPATSGVDYIVSVDGVNGVQGNIKLNWGLGNMPVISLQPTNRQAVAGGSASFSASGSGLPAPGYQWRFNGTPMANQTNSSLNLNNINSGHAGSYTVVVSNFVGSVTSSVASLTLLVPPSISVGPQSRTVRVGSSTNLSVAASGSAPLAFQWQKEGANLPGQTALQLLLTNLQTNQSGSYRVVVTNLAGSATSSPALLTVLGPLLSGPGGATVSNGVFQLRWLNGINLAVIEASTNLTLWVPVATNPVVNGVVDFSELISARDFRFYRARD